MYKCRVCGNEFIPNNHQIKKADYMCKPCTKTYMAEYRKRRKESGNPVLSSKTWDENKKKLFFEAYNSDPKKKARIAERMRSYRQDEGYRVKEKARGDLARAVKLGKIIKKPCEVCGYEKAEAHHDDYSKPLDVVWLCRSHHVERHLR